MWTVVRVPVVSSFLVTGGAGFVGSTLAFAIRRRWPDSKVVALDNLRRRGSERNLPRLKDAGVEFFHGDVRNPEDLEGVAPADFLLECSAEPSVEAGYEGGPRYVLNTNLFGTVNCLEYARRHGSKVVFFSSSRVYPMAPLNAARYIEQPTRFEWTDGQVMAGVSSRGVTETCSLVGARSFYGATKLASEMLCEEYAHAFDLGVVVNRCGVVAGPWQLGKIDQGILAFWVARHHFGGALDYLGFGGAGKQLRDFLHAEDLAELVLDQIQGFDGFRGQTFNVGGGPAASVSLCELTALCREATGRAIPVGSRDGARRADLRIYVSDCSKLFRATNWRPKHSVQQIVADIADWVREYEDTVRILAG